jgi:uncharacterized HhH-GPD family protein
MTGALDWARLTQHLEASTQDRVEMSLASIERVVGGGLPASSRGPQFWSNTSRRAASWTGPGFRVTRRGLPAGHVAFVREGEAPPAPAVVPAPVLGLDPAVNRLVVEDPFAFLLGLIFDHGIPSDRAWRAPYDLRDRLGHLDPSRIADESAQVRGAVAQPPVLHRYKRTVADWVVGAAGRVVTDYGGDAAVIWGDEPTRQQLRRRLLAFTGIGETKASKAVEMLEVEHGVRIRPDAGEVA